MYLLRSTCYHNAAELICSILVKCSAVDAQREATLLLRLDLVLLVPLRSARLAVVDVVVQVGVLAKLDAVEVDLYAGNFRLDGVALDRETWCCNIGSNLSKVGLELSIVRGVARVSAILRRDGNAEDVVAVLLEVLSTLGRELKRSCATANIVAALFDSSPSARLRLLMLILYTHLGDGLSLAI